MVNPKQLTLHDAIIIYGSDVGFEPSVNAVPTDAPPGSPEKLEILRERISRGETLFTGGDRNHYEGVDSSRIPRPYTQRENVRDRRVVPTHGHRVLRKTMKSD